MKDPYLPKFQRGDWAVYKVVPASVAMQVLRVDGDVVWRQAKWCEIDSPVASLRHATDAEIISAKQAQANCPAAYPPLADPGKAQEP